MPATIEKLGEHIGAAVSGVDICSPIDEETLSQLRQAFHSHSVLVFRDQEITDEQHVAFSEGFGPLEMTIPNDPVGDGGPIGVICNVDDSGDLIPPDDKRMLYQKGNHMWHSDGAFRRVPLRGSLLSAKEVPPAGGETEYASLRAAYASLPEARKSLIEDLAAEHSLAHSRAQIAPDLMEDEFVKNTPPAPHPLVRMIPETGEKVLLVGAYATHIIDWPVEEGRGLLRELLEWATQPQFVYRHEWQLHDLVMWDNVSCLHRGRPWDGWNHRRVMHRTTLSGDDLVSR
jgi:alpha-ketoglutarate-dependent 2,4-dichlorophenoxyacetate dioxygenase